MHLVVVMERQAQGQGGVLQAEQDHVGDERNAGREMLGRKELAARKRNIPSAHYADGAGLPLWQSVDEEGFVGVALRVIAAGLNDVAAGRTLDAAAGMEQEKGVHLSSRRSGRCSRHRCTGRRRGKKRGVYNLEL